MRLLGKNNKLLATPENRVGPNYAIAASAVLAMLIPICGPAYLVFVFSMILPYLMHLNTNQRIDEEQTPHGS